MLPDFLTIKRNRKNLRHSAKGSTWEEHKYIKRVDGTYYYPDSYEGGRHLPDGDNSKKEESKDSETEEKREKLDLSENDIENLAREVIRGNYGNGQERKDLLGENYQEIQDRVNQILKSSGASNQKMSSASKDTVEAGKQILEEALRGLKKEEKKSTTKKGIDLDSVYNVYKK